MMILHEAWNDLSGGWCAGGYGALHIDRAADSKQRRSATWRKLAELVNIIGIFTNIYGLWMEHSPINGYIMVYLMISPTIIGIIWVLSWDMMDDEFDLNW